MQCVALLPAVLALNSASPYPRGTYDPTAARDYFSKQPLEVAGRALELVAKSAGFGVSLLSDALSDDLEKRADERASELVTLLTNLGPTFIKAGQSASIRTDLLPPAYINGLTALQDQVPPFPSDEARRIIREELGRDASSVFSELSDTPVAAASLGQVYRGTLPDGTAVAVKVQRPDMDRRIALDMLLIRDFAAPLAKLVGVPGDLVGTADAWGKGFVDELNYEDEKTNAERFNTDVARSSLSGRVFAPNVIDSCSTRRVLTTEWIVGERLDRSSVPEDVPRLCSVAMNIYLEMMLDTGVLHCDPHPGNLLRTPDGKLCILDWGLVTTVRPDLQLTLIEHVAHLTAEDYGKVPGDLVKLGFVPEGGESIVMGNGVVDYLTDTYSTWKSGGGAAKLDVPVLFNRVRELAAESDNGIFQIPPYFAYVAKSFSVLEGIVSDAPTCTLCHVPCTHPPHHLISTRHCPAPSSKDASGNSPSSHSLTSIPPHGPHTHIHLTEPPRPPLATHLHRACRSTITTASSTRPYHTSRSASSPTRRRAPPARSNRSSSATRRLTRTLACSTPVASRLSSTAPSAMRRPAHPRPTPPHLPRQRCPPEDRASRRRCRQQGPPCQLCLGLVQILRAR